MYPVFLDLSAKKCLVVGGGRIALRKVIALLRAGAEVTVVSIEFCPKFSLLKRRIIMQRRPFDESDIGRPLSLIIGATNSSEVNRKISSLAASFNIPCNIVDQPQLCSFIVPAVVRRGDVTIAISTGGSVPRLSRYLKTVAAKTIGPEYGTLAAYLSTIRKRVRDCIADAHLRAQFWEALFENDPVVFINSLGWEAFRETTEKLIITYTLQAKADEK